MATPKKNEKPQEKFIKDGETLPGAGATADDAIDAGTDVTAGDATETGTDVTTGDATDTSTDVTAGDATDTGTDVTAGDATDASTDVTAGDATDAATDGTTGDASTNTGTAVLSSWFTVQVVRSPTGKRFRAGIEFTSQPTPYDFSLFSDEQIEKLSADPFLRIKPYTPAEE